MPLWVIVKIALRGLAANKLRTFLTMLGVIIGVGSVIAMLAIGEGAKLQVTRQIESLGVQTLMLRPGMRGMSGARTADVQNLTLQDAEAIKRELPGVLAAAPEVGANPQVSYLNRNTRTRALGVTPDYLLARSFRIHRGRMFTEEEDRELRHVCVLGSKVMKDLYPDEDPLGTEVKIAGKIFTVIGTMEEKGDQGFMNPDDQVYVPLQVGMKQVFGTQAGAGNALRAIHVYIDAGGADITKQMKDAELRLDRFMKQRHKILPGDPPDFYIMNMAEYLRQTEETSRTFTVLLGSVAGISLLVGGIGIMNIMLVTVTERTKEIGIRKALGARPWDILKQFVIEAVVVSMVGGTLGVAAGLGLSELVPKLNDWFEDIPKFETAPTTSSVALSFAFAAVIGIFFGWYPARKAARMDPIEALRYE